MPGSIRDRLRQQLRDALKSQAAAELSALRATLAAIDNAEAVEVTSEDLRGLPIESSPVGLGAREVQRKRLSEDQIIAVIRRELGDREAAAIQYAEAGHEGRATRLLAEADALRRVLE